MRETYRSSRRKHRRWEMLLSRRTCWLLISSILNRRQLFVKNLRRLIAKWFKNKLRLLLSLMAVLWRTTQNNKMGQVCRPPVAVKIYYKALLTLRRRLFKTKLGHLTKINFKCFIPSGPKRQSNLPHWHLRQVKQMKSKKTPKNNPRMGSQLTLAQLSKSNRYFKATAKDFVKRLIDPLYKFCQTQTKL